MKFIFALIISISTFASEPIALPFISKLSGVDPFYGAAGGIKNIYKKGFDLLAVASFGDVKGFALLASNYPITNDFKLSLGLLKSSEATYETTYARGLKEDIFYRQKLELSAINVNVKRELSKTSNLSLLLTLSKRKFLDYETENEENIPISLKRFFDEEALTVAFKYSLDEVGETRLKNGKKVKAGLSYISGREGQSDNLIVDLLASKHHVINNSSKVVGFLKSSHAFVLSEYKTSANEIDGECSTISDTTARANCNKLESDVNKFIVAHNRYGTARPLGGNMGLRGYREFRFKSAHNLMVGTEFDYIAIEKPEIHIVPFFETGFAHDRFERIWDSARYNTGLSLRYYLGNMPIRLTGATGNEGETYFLSAALPF
ncbi:MAG: hypothetical protein BM556_01745 [Bacteriovorax sp. MedPE-SWde]|nr:MAG: hypothetical protein BM556_01745 [Bacteriovorax sp. MedPE-SWde]